MEHTTRATAHPNFNEVWFWRRGVGELEESLVKKHKVILPRHNGWIIGGIQGSVLIPLGPMFLN